MDEAQRRKEHFQDEHVTTLHPNYMGVFWWLLALTILELICGSLPTGPTYPYFVKVVLLVSMAVSKAALVALYFMHLRFEVRTLGIIALTPMILCAFFLFMLMPDSIAMSATGAGARERRPRHARAARRRWMTRSAERAVWLGLGAVDRRRRLWRACGRCAGAGAASRPAGDRDRCRRSRSIERIGRAISRDDLAGQPWVADFIFTRCSGMCPALSTRMAELRRALRERGCARAWCRSASIRRTTRPRCCASMRRASPPTTTTGCSSPASATRSTS